ncbi:30S ribosomal protein S20 [Pseudenhygromyxa sp. WMMC2535]|uniref:30S ribosomal protein S20 n=1 Tax=Pseudenhygromyxa sp. WMMC2535 TaxID=2712867 RepID=UPI0015528E6A|nr:30S ribosomal protein S20 [Pseudenhygromyxa sp. WMMC2535]NVB41635.1 30S ribosomal protein S20 [Pseudenhygromyxa sp. WMMC2535]NVB43489.1 30S ribosomal protein S20 [Pseudenhygromyxa sp. WMMC2535]
MANHKQAEKRNRQRIKRRSRNLLHLSTMRTYIKRVRRAIDDGDLEVAKSTLPTALKAIGKASSKGVIHQRTASRYSSRLTLAVSRAEAETAAEANA